MRVAALGTRCASSALREVLRDLGQGVEAS
jgi:hypothetical protein